MTRFHGEPGRVLTRVGVLGVVAALGTWSGCPAKASCGPEQVEHQGACLNACNSTVDCGRFEQCDNGACVAAGDGGASSSSSTGLLPASSSSWAPVSGNSGSSAFPPASSSAGEPSASSFSASSSSSSSASSTSGGCGTVPEGGACGSASECACGLVCTGAACRQTCTTPGETGACPAGHACADVGGGQAACLVGAARGDGCATESCVAGLTCDEPVRDSSGSIVAAARVCHQRCAWGSSTNSCGMGERCLPSTQGANEVQLAGANPVTCSLATGDSGCDTAQAFHCRTVSSGTFCVRPIAACGVAIAPADLRPLADGGAPTVSFNDVCNLGPTTTLSGGAIPANRFCDDYATLPDPPDVECREVFQGGAPGLGVCFAVCRYPAIGSTPLDVRDCPAGYTCNTADSRLMRYVLVNSQPVTCAVDGDCASFPEAVCRSVAGTQRCALMLGTCQP